MSITASAIYVKVAGSIEAGSLDTTAHAFSIAYSSGAAVKTMGVDYGPAKVEGALADGAWIEVKLYGNSDGRFLAKKVEVESEGTMTEE
jgi:hypothetical protein